MKNSGHQKQPHSSANSSTILVDLGQQSSAAALEQLVDNRGRSCVQSAFVHTQSCRRQDGIGRRGLMGVFESLGCLDQLRQVTIDLSLLHCCLPVSTLTRLLSGAKQLKELKLSHVSLAGTIEQFGRLEVVLENHNKLSHIAMAGCTGRTTLLQRSLCKLPNLERLSLSNTTLAVWVTNPITTSTTLLDLGLLQALKSLTLQDVPNLHVDDFLTMCQHLSDSTYDGCLEELEIKSSSRKGALIGASVAQMLLTNRTVEKLTLQLSEPWESCGESMAAVLRSNPVLTSLNLSIFGGLVTDVISKASLIAQALDSPCSHLKHLHLRLDMDAVLDGSLLGTDLMQTLEKVLETNDRIECLCLLDVCSEPFELSSLVQDKLALNQSGIPRLLQHRHMNSVSFEQSYSKAIIASKDNLDILFHALSHHPSILSSCRLSSSCQGKPSHPGQPNIPPYKKPAMEGLPKFSQQKLVSRSKTVGRLPKSKLYHRFFSRPSSPTSRS